MTCRCGAINHDHGDVQCQREAECLVYGAGGHVGIPECPRCAMMTLQCEFIGPLGNTRTIGEL